MKWFHHECAAKHDPKLQTLAASHGAEGLGIYWGLLEEIGQHSDTFHVKISGVSAIADGAFDEILLDGAKAPPRLTQAGLALGSVPRFPLKILAKILFTTPQKLERVIQSAIEVGLFDKALWNEYSMLHSPAFTRRADDYTRRVQRRHASVHTVFEGTPDSSRTALPAAAHASTNSITEQTRADTEVMKKDESRTAVTDLALHMREFRTILADWNRYRVNPFLWNPSETELERLFLGGNEGHKEALCRAWGTPGRFPDLVLKALKLMLESSEQRRIANPAGWIWSCLHGNGDGKGPWIQTLRESGSS